MGVDWECGEEKLGEGRPEDRDDGGLESARNEWTPFSLEWMDSCKDERGRGRNRVVGRDLERAEGSRGR